MKNGKTIPKNKIVQLKQKSRRIENKMDANIQREPENQNLSLDNLGLKLDNIQFPQERLNDLHAKMMVFFNDSNLMKKVVNNVENLALKELKKRNVKIDAKTQARIKADTKALAKLSPKANTKKS